MFSAILYLPCQIQARQFQTRQNQTGRNQSCLSLKLLFIGLCLSFFSGAKVWAEESVDLYRAETLVASQSVEERNAAARASLTDLIVRISGRRDSVQEPSIELAIARAQSYLLEFSYGSSDVRIERDGRELTATGLSLKFSPQAIEQLLRQANLPLWPSNRPSILLWLVQDDRRDGRIYSANTEYIHAIKRMAERRGLPVQQPLLDLEDRMNVTPNELWRFDTDRIQIASKRYGADVVVVGRFSEVSRWGQTQWLANWQVLRNDGDSLLESQGESAAAVLAEGIEQIADDLASRYAIVTDDSSDSALIMQLANIGDFADYAQVIDYLESLAMVRAAQPIYTRSSQLWLSLETEGDLNLLLNALLLDKKLLLPETPEILLDHRYSQLGSYEKPLRYYWRHRTEMSFDRQGPQLSAIIEKDNDGELDKASDPESDIKESHSKGVEPATRFLESGE